MPETSSLQRIFTETCVPVSPVTSQNVYRSENCCTLGTVSVDEYAPSVLLVATLFSELPVLDATVVSNRTEFVTLNTSQANFSPCRSVMFHVFVSPESISKKPSPRKLFLCPASPGYGSRSGEPVLKPLLSAVGSAKTFGAPSIKCLRSFTCPVATTPLSTCQFVVHAGSTTPNGSPLLHRLSPESCQPPISAFTPRPALPAKRCPSPNGS